MTEGSGTGNGRNRGRRKRRSQGYRSRRSPQGNRDTSNRPNSSQSNRRRRPRKRQQPNQSSRARVDPKVKVPSQGATRHFTGELNEFELFCAFHLGINEKGGHYQPNINEVARRFDAQPDDIQRALQDYRMDRERISSSSFNLDLAKLDIEVAPPGIDRVELARTIFKDFLESGCGIGPVPSYIASAAVATHSSSGPRDSEPEVGTN